MPLTLQDLYAHPEFIAKVEQPIKAEIMGWTFDRESPGTATPTGVSLGTVRFFEEDEERIQGEVVVMSKLEVGADISTRSGEQTSENIHRDVNGVMNFSLPWSWQAKDLEFVVESAQVALTDLWTD
jgi:hypothetical protein